MGLKGCLKHLFPGFDHIFCQSIMDYFRSQHADSTMPMLGVVPGKEKPAKCHSVLQGAKSIRKPGTILQGFELALRIGVIVRYMGPIVGFVDTQGHKKLCRSPRNHRRSPIRMDGQLPRIYLLFLTALPDQLLCQSGGFPRGHHPSHNIPAEDIQNYIEVK